MKKLKLELETLRVDSFEPSPARRREGGTVRAHALNSADSWCSNNFSGWCYFTGYTPTEPENQETIDPEVCPLD